MRWRGAGGGEEWSALTSPSPETRFHLIALRHCPSTDTKHMSSLVSTYNVSSRDASNIHGRHKLQSGIAWMFNVLLELVDPLVEDPRVWHQRGNSLLASSCAR